MAFVATFSLGAFLAFTYSYIPLHTVKDRKLGSLEQTMLQHEETIAALEGKLEGIESGSDAAAHEKVVASLESERDAANEDIRAIRADLKKAEKRAKQLEGERSDWKRKVASLEKKLAQAPAARIAQAPARDDSATESPQATQSTPTAQGSETREPALPLAGTPPPMRDADAAAEEPQSEPLPASPAP